MKRLRRLANQLVSAQLGPQERDLEQERARSAAAITGFTKGLADELGSIAPAVQQTYSQAAGAQNNFAKGFADGLRQMQAQTGAQNADIVQNIAGGGQTIDTTGAGDVLFGSSGFIPASTLNQAGAAATAYAQQLPGFTARAGQDQLAANQAEFRRAMEELRKQRPELYRQTLQDLLQFELSKFGANINAGYLQNARRGQRQDFALGMAGLAQRQREQQQDARERRRGNKQDRRERRRDAWTDFRDDAESRAEALYERKKPNPNYNPLLPPGPNNPEYIPDRPSWMGAYELIWNRYGRDLMKMGIRKEVIRNFIFSALRNAGFVPSQPPTGEH